MILHGTWHVRCCCIIDFQLTKYQVNIMRILILNNGQKLDLTFTTTTRTGIRDEGHQLDTFMTCSVGGRANGGIPQGCTRKCCLDYECDQWI